MIAFLDSISDEGRRLGAAASAGWDIPLRSCPGWTGRDLLAHTCGFARFLVALFDGQVRSTDPVDPVAPPDAARTWDGDLAALVDTLRAVPPDAPVGNWSIAPPTAAFWVRRAAHELAVHRWDAGTTLTASPAPIATDLARDGIAEFFEVFVATGLAAGMVPPAAVTLVLEPTDGPRIEQHLPEPGPVTVLRGTTSDLLLALWHRRDLMDLYVSGDRGVLETWPHI